MRAIMLGVSLLLSFSCGEPPANSCPDDLVLQKLSGAALEKRGNQNCVSRSPVVVGEFCFEPMQFGEEVDEYADGSAWVVVEPHNEHVLDALAQMGFRKLSSGEIGTCAQIDAQ